MLHFMTSYMKQNKSRKQTLAKLSRVRSTDWKSALILTRLDTSLKQNGAGAVTIRLSR